MRELTVRLFITSHQSELIIILYEVGNV